MPFNAKKNRYKDIVPYDYCRVMLPQIPGVEGSDYINASYLNTGNDQRCTIIAAQGPLPQTVVDFWRMLWSHNIKVVVMAANVFEGGKKKCEKYWPDVGSPLTFDQIHVEQVRTDNTHAPDFIVHELRISCQGHVRSVAAQPSSICCSLLCDFG
jgi:tyrosine-protein phosphatase non-receptor type 12/18/22